jgi:S-adenosylmethionine:tRNA ribosyltransferase-isomerase
MEEGYINIRISDYSYDLPDDKIAKYPLPQRDASRLLTWNGKTINDIIFKELPSVMDPQALLVFNNTRVIRARLHFRKDNGAEIEIFCLEPHEPHDYAQNLSSSGNVEWKCLIGNLKRWKQGILKKEFVCGAVRVELYAEKVKAEGDTFIIRFSWEDLNISFGEVLETMGHVPIPPYLGRNDEASDVLTYQTVYASINGSVAAPTAGLHFTPAVLDALTKKGVETADITLHVSAGTFRPVKTELICDHIMHTEHFYVTPEALHRFRSRKITAVGTTTVRTLESLYWLGIKCAEGRWPVRGNPSVSQWEPYGNDTQMDMDTAIDHLLLMMEHKGIEILEATTDVIIVPGYRFRVVNSMLTNFHQPGSTLLLLVAAFTGEAWKEIYRHALSSGYRFLSYGDSMLLKKPGRLYRA